MIAAFLSSSHVAGLSEVAALLLAFPVAYAIARIPSRLSGLTEAIFVTGFLVPNFALLLPVFLLIANMGLLHNPLALVLVYTAHVLPKSVILLASVMRPISSRTGGERRNKRSQPLQLMWHIFLPLSIARRRHRSHSEFHLLLGRILFCSGPDQQCNWHTADRHFSIYIPTALSVTASFGGHLFSMIPVYLVFIFFSERIMTGMLAGAVKE